ncbi:hypothetical protein FOL47_008875 [Perkinsus chesapeaki]|uniref:PARG helical domain-containing protein n=1 Tax=Perkinsus chesapeaki TaxID=330153 RepID=A0A7J6MSV3_PERCH|nr:hypothetical protein FOL47_008875 [Perkinsus chesapeaki]
MPEAKHLVLPFDIPESWELISKELTKVKAHDFHTLQSWQVCGEDGMSKIHTAEEYQQLLCRLAHHSGCVPLNLEAMKQNKNEKTKKSSKHTDKKKERKSLPSTVEVPSNFADVSTLLEQLKGISPELHDVFFNFTIPKICHLVLSGPEAFAEERRPKLVLKGHNGSVTVSTRTSLYVLCCGFLCLLPANQRLASPNFKRFFYRSNGNIPTQAQKLVCILNYFNQALGYAPLRPVTVPKADEQDTEERTAEGQEVEMEYEDPAYEKLVKLNSNEAYLRITRRALDIFAPQSPPCDGWLDEEWWASCESKLCNVHVAPPPPAKTTENDTNRSRYLPYGEADTDQLSGKTLLGLTTNKPFGDALGLGTGVEEAYAMEHPDVLLALALCEPTSTGTIPENISVCGGRRYSEVAGIGGSFSCSRSVLDACPSIVNCPDTGHPLISKEIVSLVRLARTAKANKDDGLIAKTAECIDTLNELVLSIASTEALLRWKGQLRVAVDKWHLHNMCILGCDHSKEDDFPIPTLPVKAPLVLYPLANSTPLGTMRVSPEARFILLWLAASTAAAAAARPMVLWDRLGELRHTAVRIDIEEIRESLVRVVEVCRSKGLLAKHALGYLLDYGLESSEVAEQASNDIATAQPDVLRALFSTITAGV